MGGGFANHHHAHQGFHRRGTLGALHNHTSSGNGTLSDAELLIEHALSVLAEINKARVEQPSLNSYKLMSKSDIDNQGLADPLDLASNSSSILKRQSESEDDDKKIANNTDAAEASPYTIPSALAEAAKLVAESRPQTPSGDHGSVAAAIRRKYALKQNDTNEPDPLDLPDGLLGTFGPERREKRAASYWMTEMGSSGSAPFAPAGYKVSEICLTREMESTKEARCD